MEENYSFGYWVRRRRKALDLTQEALAAQVGCTRSAVKKIEADERRPSQLMAARLAECLRVPEEERALFIESALGVRSISRLPVAAEPLPAPPLAILAAPLTPFIGRMAEVSNMRAMLMQSNGRLLTVLGPPGVGKTRLAIEVARTMADSFRDGVRFVDFAPVFDADLAPATLAQAIGIPHSDATPEIDRLKDRLRQSEMLLVLDNFEHVMGAATMVAELLAGCPGLRCLVTSRSPLELRGERRFPIAPLALPELSDEQGADRSFQPDQMLSYPAIALFVECAAAVAPGFTLTADNAAAIGAICRSLDGLPLAIELAAPHIRVLSPEALLARLQGSWALSLEGARDISKHQQTLRSAIAWSYTRLTPPEQALFRQMAVFLGGSPFGVAESVWSRYAAESPDADVLLAPDAFLQHVTSLVDRSLIRVEPGGEDQPRLFMLDLVRSYALEQIELHGETEAARRRHAIEFARLVAEAEPDAHSARQTFWWRVFNAEIHNLRAALDWTLSAGAVEMAAAMCAGLRHFWITQNYLQEAWRWIERTLAAVADRDQPLPPLSAARLYNAAGSVAFYRNDQQAARSSFDAALGEARLADDERSMAYALDGLAVVAAAGGWYEESRALSGQSLALSRRVGDHWLSAIALMNLGEIARLAGQVEPAAELYVESLALMRAAGDLSFTAVALHNLGQVAFDRGDITEADAFLRESLDISVSIADYRVVAADLEKLAEVACESGESVRAAWLLGAAQGLRQTYGLPVHPLERENAERVATAIRTQIGAARYVDALYQSAAMPLADALHLIFDEEGLR